MMTTLAHFYIARLVLENETPLSVGANGSDGVYDLRLVRDANGLPAIPATSLTGVLRSLYGDDKDQPFGFQNSKEGQSSSVQISWAHITDSQGKYVHGLETDTNTLTNDSLLKLAFDTLSTPVFRDRVSINHRGVAKNTGKFDRSILPAGFRFVCEMSLWSDKENDPRWHKLLGLLQHHMFRIGGNTRSGLGKMKLHQLFGRAYNLTTSEDRTAFSSLSRRLDDTTSLTNILNQLQTLEHGLVTATLTLKPEGFWRIGGGNISHKKADDKEPDMLPKTETRIVWEASKPTIQQNSQEPLLIPATGIKGALSHRITFHDNCLNARWAEDVLAENNDEPIENTCVQQLFGYAKDSNNQISASGQIGHVIIDDVYLTHHDFGIQMHNCIDRFTGGVRDRMLFSEELAWKSQQPISIKITFDKHRLSELNHTQKTAIVRALNDLCEGRLPLGGGSNKGHGFMKGTCEWTDNGAWIAGDNA
jgi:CRISPR/Cas system CSM-associated protein Csm3 (group 7 of RAMP superfamily)